MKIGKIPAVTIFDKEQFHCEIVPQGKPVIIKSLVSDWPAVAHASNSVDEISDYIKSFDNQTPVYTIVGLPQIKGRFFYNDNLQGVNFQHVQSPISSALEHLLALKDQAEPHAIAVQSAAIRHALPGFEAENPMELVNSSVAPTLWIGNKAVVAPHYDVHNNIACVVSGKRRFTLFPPEQIANLYIGPTLCAPGGVPISLVDMNKPDFKQFPNYAKALDSALQATLEPGDAIYIPALWWHGVESLDDINMLVNYWWGGISDTQISPRKSLLHSMLSIANLDANQRESWKHFYDYFVFKTSKDPAEHLPEEVEDIVTTLSEPQKRELLEMLKNSL